LRHEFPAKIKRAALERSGGRCEAVGPRWGHLPGVRCNADLAATGVQHDHYPLGAHAEGSNTLENDVVCCPRCNQWAANHTDKAVEAKIKRVQRKHGTRPDTRKHKPKPIRSQGFQPGSRPIPSRPFSTRKPKP
jgi:hypothetical protein